MTGSILLLLIITAWGLAAVGGRYFQKRHVQPSKDYVYMYAGLALAAFSFVPGMLILLAKSLDGSAANVSGLEGAIYFGLFALMPIIIWLMVSELSKKHFVAGSTSQVVQPPREVHEINVRRPYQRGRFIDTSA